jgi:hypothetical protein
MVPLGGDSWTFGTSTDLTIDFCVWVLQVDGLRVAPFDRHPDGDGRLRDIGLNETDWRVWFAEMVRKRPARGESLPPDPVPEDDLDLLYSPEPPSAEDVERYRKRLQDRTPAGQWHGNPAISNELLRLWIDYVRRRSQQSRESCARRPRERMRLPPEAQRTQGAGQRRLWTAIQRYRPLPPLDLLIVTYPARIVQVFPPDRAVLAQPHPETVLYTSDEAFEEQILEAARQLSGR